MSASAFRLLALAALPLLMAAAPPDLDPVGLPTIDPDTPQAKLLPAAPPSAGAVYLGSDLAEVPEVTLDAERGLGWTGRDWRRHRARTVAAALHLCEKEQDGYLRAVVASRRDLGGLPFVTGKACRTTGFPERAFRHMAEIYATGGNSNYFAPGTALDVLNAFGDSPKDEVLADPAKATQAHRAQVGAVAQVFGPADSPQHVNLPATLMLVPHPEATRQLARLAVFSTDPAVRRSVIEGLSVRRERDATATLVEALRYPWPAVAANAAEAIAKLDRRDLMPELIDMLDAPDPRGPVVTAGKPVVRELVRINHHRNCLLCHAPVRPVDPEIGFAMLTGPIPAPTELLLHPQQGYGPEDTRPRVRIDVTYLRQDFSVMQAVDECSQWPTMQRFDFVVRTRTLSDAEADDVRARLGRREPGELSPYQKAAVAALRAMTGRDFEARAEVWRRHLKLPR